MQDTINFLRVLDSHTNLQPHSRQGRQRYKSESKGNASMRQSQSRSNGTPPRKKGNSSINYQKFQYRKGLQFGQQKLQMFPLWLKSREDFVDFMYSNYEKKMLALPKICEKPPNKRTSDELYFLSMYLSQIDIFQKLPHSIEDIILRNLNTRYYKKADLIHADPKKCAQFMGIVFLGSVEIVDPEEESSGSHLLKKPTPKYFRNSVILKRCFYGKPQQAIAACEEVILLTLERDVYRLIQEQLSEELLDKYKQEMDQLPKSDLFTQLHIKDRRCKQLLGDLIPQFYFRGETIAECGEDIDQFYIVLHGSVRRQNHIYVREHNKWPLPRSRWEIRAVYKTYQNHSLLDRYSFFGDEQLFSGGKVKATYSVVDHSVLLVLPRDQFRLHINGEDQKKLKKYRNEHMAVNYPEFERGSRKHKKDLQYKRRIVQQAIDVSYCNKSTLPELQNTRRKIQHFEDHMLKNIESILGQEASAPE